MRSKEINVAFKKPVHKILEWIKNKPYFRWPSKMGGDLTRRNQNLYCTHHRDKWHATKQCRVFKDHLEQLVKSGHLKEFVMAPKNGATRQVSRAQGNPLPPPLGIIEVIHTASIGIRVSRRKGVLSVVSMENAECDSRPGKKLKMSKD